MAREFITLLGGATVWPFAVRAQQSALPVIGFLNHGSEEGYEPRLRAFREGISQSGYVEGQNVRIEYRWANNDIHLLSKLAADLVRDGVTVISTPVSTPAALAAKRATASIPVIFGIGTDPVHVGLVASFNHPGGNVTGICTMNWELGAKRIGLLRALLPKATRFAVLVNPNVPEVAGPFMKDVQAAAAAVGVQIEILNATTTQEIDLAFAKFSEKPADALLVSTDTLRVLKGEKPADLPVLRASKFNFVINLSTARAMGLQAPVDVLALADEVIE
jgi:putative tryptophan/tyrosine transport system substrate-binding protein